MDYYREEEAGNGKNMIDVYNLSITIIRKMNKKSKKI